MRKRIIVAAVSLGMILSTLVSTQTVIASPIAPSIKFASPKVHILPGNPACIDAADLDGDGKLDAVVAYAQGNQAAILKGNNDGTFTEEENVFIGSLSNPMQMITPTQVIAKGAGSSQSDSLIIGSQQSVDIFIKKADSNGKFIKQLSLYGDPAGGEPRYVAEGDFDNDNLLDVALLYDNSRIDIVKKVTTDACIVMMDVPGGRAAGLVRKIVAGDFDGDGKPDLAGASYLDSSISILKTVDPEALLASFVPLGQYQSGGNMVADIITGDFNDDGHLDLAAANAVSKNIGILLGRGDGTFGVPIVYPLFDTPRRIQQGDFNRDAHMDLVVVTDRNAAIMCGTGNGTFLGPEICIRGTQLNDVVVKDFNKDGLPDLMFSDYAARDISVLLNNTVNRVMNITATALSDGVIGIPYSESVSATGGTLPYTWSASGLPDGLVIDAATGQISGIPTVTTTSVIHITVNDSTGLSFSKDLSLTVNPAGLNINTNSLPAGTVGTYYSSILHASGGVLPYTWTSSGLPGGLSISASTGELCGTPNVTTTSVIHITVTDNNGISTSRDLNLTINPAAPSGGGNTGGSSSGGGSSSSSLASPSTTVPASPDTLVEVLSTENSRTVFTMLQPQIGTNGQAAVNITEKQIKDLMKKLAEQSSSDKENERKVIEIKIAAPEGTKKAVFSIPKAAMERMSESSQNALFTVTSSEAILLFNKEALDAIGRQAEGDIKIEAGSVDLNTLTPEQQAKIGDRPVFNFTVQSGGKSITSFGNGQVRISIPYTLKPGEDPNKIIIYYINEKGELVKVPTCTYDALTGMVHFITNHFSVYGIGHSNVSFMDVSGMYAEEIDHVAARGIMNGKKINQFVPKSWITRAEFIQILANMAGADLNKYTTSPFTDVKNGVWYSKATAWAYEKGITGDTETTFRPKEAITRQDMAQMLSLYAHKVENYTFPITKEPVKFDDNSSIADYAKTAVLEMQQAGIISGRGNNLFDPKAAVSRAETAKMIAGLIKAMTNSESFNKSAK